MGGVYRLESGGVISTNRSRLGAPMALFNLLLAQEISKVCDGVAAVADELLLGLLTSVFLAIDIRDDCWDLTVCRND